MILWTSVNLIFVSASYLFIAVQGSRVAVVSAGSVNICLNVCVSLLVPVYPVCVFVCVCDIKSECKQKPCCPCQSFNKFDALLHKTHEKMCLALRYESTRSLGP